MAPHTLVCIALQRRMVVVLTVKGIAFCETSGQPPPVDNIPIVQTWPGNHGVTGSKEKVPSEISYSADGTVLWGFSIPPQAQRQVWTKLELDEQKRGEELKMLLELLNGIEHL